MVKCELGSGQCLTPRYSSFKAKLVEKTSVIRLPKFTIVNMAENCHQPASFSKENTFFVDYFFGSLMSDIFFN